MNRSVYGLTSLVLTLSAALLVGCGDGDSGKPGADGTAPAPEVKGGYAVGRVTMPDGKPIAAPGASLSVSISGVSEAGERVQYSPIVKPDGTYSQKLAPGAYTFNRSTVETQFEGQKYRFQLEPVGDAHNKNRESAEGISQDFVWKMTGEKPGSDHNINNHTNWYGGSIGVRFSGWRNDINKAPPALPDGTKVVFTLKPTTAKRVDGADAQSLTIERKYNAQWTQCDALNDIPPAFYELTGVATLADGSTKPLLFEVSYAKYAAVQPIKFEPYSTMDHVTTPLTAWVIE